MATLTLAQTSSVYGGLVTLSVAGAAGSSLFNDACVLPVGFGDVLILDALFEFASAATAVTDLNTMRRGVRALVKDSGNTAILQICGIADFMDVFGLADPVIAAYMRPENPVLLKELGQRLSVTSAQLDSNGAPTGVVTVTLTVRRLAI